MTSAVGHWEEIEHEIWDTVVTPCDCCGQVVARQMWIVDVDGVRRRFCSPKCEELYAARERISGPSRLGESGITQDADRSGRR